MGQGRGDAEDGTESSQGLRKWKMRRARSRERAGQYASSCPAHVRVFSCLYLPRLSPPSGLHFMPFCGRARSCSHAGGSLPQPGSPRHRRRATRQDANGLKGETRGKGGQGRDMRKRGGRGETRKRGVGETGVGSVVGAYFKQSSRLHHLLEPACQHRPHRHASWPKQEHTRARREVKEAAASSSALSHKP